MAQKQVAKKTSPSAAKTTKGYGKRPYWQWIVLYLIIGGIIYWIAYMVFFADTGGYNY